MGVMANVIDGQLQTSTASSASLKNESKKSNDIASSDTFLQLLVAEMKNQDPLEPTSNTEWVSQYATFTQVSEIQSIGDNMSSIQAQNLVGKDVVLSIDNEEGTPEEVTGRVDYVTYDAGKAYLTIDGKQYSASDLKCVVDAEYSEATKLAEDILNELKKLPPVQDLTLSHKDSVVGLKNVIENMSAYQKQFLDESIFDGINEYYNRMKGLVDSYNEKLAAAEAAAKEALEKEAAAKEALEKEAAEKEALEKELTETKGELADEKAENAELSKEIEEVKSSEEATKAKEEAEEERMTADSEESTEESLENLK